MGKGGLLKSPLTSFIDQLKVKNHQDPSWGRGEQEKKREERERRKRR